MTKEEKKLRAKIEREITGITIFDKIVGALIEFFIFSCIPFLIITMILAAKGPYSNLVAIIILVYMTLESVTFIAFFVKEILKTLRRK